MRRLVSVILLAAFGCSRDGSDEPPTVNVDVHINDKATTEKFLAVPENSESEDFFVVPPREETENAP